MIERFFRPLKYLGQIEVVISHDEDDFIPFTVRPAECAPVPWEIIADALSLHLQGLVKNKLGMTLPDVRFRIITNPITDGIDGVHLGTLDGAIKKAKILKEKYEERLFREMGAPATN